MKVEEPWINSTVNQIVKITEKMTDFNDMVGVYFVAAYRKCGEPNCWCSKADNGHRVLRITFNKNKKSSSRTVPKNDEVWIKVMTDNYRNFRLYFKKLREYENKLNLLLKQFEEEVKKKSSKNKSYLNIP